MLIKGLDLRRISFVTEDCGQGKVLEESNTS